MLKITKSLSKVATIVMAAKTGYEIYQTTKTISSTFNKFKKGKKSVDKASNSFSKIAKAVKKGIADDK